MACCQREVNLFIFLLFLTQANGHYLTEPGSIIRGVRSNGKHLLTRRNSDSSIKIKVFPDPSIQNLSSKLNKLIVDRLLPDAIAYFSKTLRVRQSISPIRLQRACIKQVFRKTNGTLFRYCENECKNITKCGIVLVPEPHLDTCRTCDSQGQCTTETSRSSGVTDADFVLYFSAITTSHCNRKDDVIAYASACGQEQILDRPVAGFVNFCAEKLSKNFHYSHLLAFLKHEIFHALGFSSSLYGYYRADDGAPLTPRMSDGKPNSKWSDKVVKEFIRNDWKVSQRAGSSVRHNVQMIVMPHVVKEVRDHFGCPSLEGAEIENQGREGQRDTHLEKRVFENEAMTGIFTNNPVFSRITLALMEDTGWYRANYEMAENLDWGRNSGCIFAQNSCKAWMDYQVKNNHSISPYCTQLPFKSHTRTGCTHSHYGVGICSLVKYKTQLPIAYQYFDLLPDVDALASFYGGATMLADFCPYYQELDWKKGDTIVRGSSCKHESNNPALDNYALEMYGESSACFLQGTPWTQASCSSEIKATDWGSGCYSYACTVEGLVLSISGKSYPCQFTGQKLDIAVIQKTLLHSGSITCPVCKVLCGNSCPLVESKYFYNSSTPKTNQNVLVCSSINLHHSLGMLITFVFSILVVKI